MTKPTHLNPQHPSSPPEAPQAAKRIKGFDGLRALAVTMVIVMHKTTWGEHAQIGFYGVWLFFLLSGFLITGQLAAARERVESRGSTIRNELINFWTRRFFRIFPAYYALIGAMVVAYLIRGKSLDDAGIWWHVFYLTNVYFQYAQPDSSNSFMHFWSLAVEEQFYLLFAPIVLLAARRHTLSICIAVLVFSLVVRTAMVGLGVREFHIYINSFVNFGLLALGGILVLDGARLKGLTRHLRLGGEIAPWALLLLFLGCIALLTLAQGQPDAFRQCLFVTALFFGAALVFSIYIGQQTRFTRLMEWRPWAYYGKLSYGVYLYQTYPPADLPAKALLALARRFPVLEPLSAQAASGAGAFGLSMSVLGFVVCFAITMALAQLSWTLIERPAMRLRDRFFDSKFAGRSGHPNSLRPQHAGATTSRGRL